MPHVLEVDGELARQHVKLVDGVGVVSGQAPRLVPVRELRGAGETGSHAQHRALLRRVA